jgi:hypothetical protein
MGRTDPSFPSSEKVFPDPGYFRMILKELTSDNQEAALPEIEA